MACASLAANARRPPQAGSGRQHSAAECLRQGADHIRNRRTLASPWHFPFTTEAAAFAGAGCGIFL